MSDKTKVKGKTPEGKELTLESSKPKQLSLFQNFLPDSGQYSNTINLYDAVPKYFSCSRKLAQTREAGKYLPILKRNFRFRSTGDDNSKDYRISIKPARIEEKDGQEREYYPTEREELVEEALRKLACNPLGGVFLDNTPGVQFTLYQLQQELKRQGHSMHLQSLIDALKICNRTTLSIMNADGKTVMESAIFPILLITSRNDWELNPKEARCYVQFNPLVTKSVNELTFRQFNYDKLMSYRKQLTRWLHKRLYHNFIQAGWNNSYTILATTIIQDSGMVNNSQMRDRVKAIEESINELHAQDVIREFQRYELLEKRKIIDVKYELFPSVSFIREMKLSNTRQNQLLTNI